jgi:hypothetical protein
VPVVLLLALVGCAQRGFAVDAAVTRDAPAVDVPVMFTDAVASPDVAIADVTDAPRDEAPVDAAPDVTAARDGGFDDPCAPTRVVDLETRGARVGAVTTIAWRNTGTAPRAPLDAPCAAGMTGHVVVFRHRAATRGTLRITTNHEGTDARLDTVVFALGACAPDARRLGCGDDTGDPPRDHASTFVTDEVIEVGQTVFIAVGGFLHATRELWDSEGAFTLTVTEQGSGP